MYIDIVAEFNRVPKHRDKQIPEIKSNVLEVNRKLTDKISQRGQTEAFNQRNRIWASYIGRPRVKAPCSTVFIYLPGLITCFFLRNCQAE